MYSRLLVVMVLLTLVRSAHADWLGFRGPAHQGHAGAGDFPVKWGAAENIAWKAKLPGLGASSPVVKGERVFVTAFTGKKAPELVRHLLCFERRTGKQLWEQKRPAPQPENDYAGNIMQHGFATATPFIEGERVYVNFCRGGVFAFDLDGKEIWKRELGKYLNSFGAGSSPTIHGKLLLINATTEAGAVFALDKNTGETVWRTKIPGDSWATPVVVDTGKGFEIVQHGTEGLYGFDPETGKQLWYVEGIAGNVSSTPLVHKDVVYAMNSNFGKKTFMAVRAGGKGDVTKTHVLWSTTKAGANYCSPLMVGERIFYFSTLATCLNRATGEVIAQNRLDGIMNLYSSPILAGGKIYLFTRNQGAYVLSADEKLTVLARNELGDTTTINASPAASDGDLLIRTQEHLFCVRKK